VEAVLDRNGAAGSDFDEYTVSAGDGSGRGSRVAEFAGLSSDTYRLLVRLRDARGALVATRAASFPIRASRTVTIVITRDCLDVTCDGQTACLGGRCVPHTCIPEAPETCPTSECETVANCPAPAAACAEAACVEGTCLEQPKEPTVCESDEYCDPSNGCKPSVIDPGTLTCAEGTQRFVPGCVAGGASRTITEGCYRPCAGMDDASCPDGTVCAEASVNPCACDPEPGLSCCTACAEGRWLCLVEELPSPVPGPRTLSSLDDVCEGTSYGSITGRQILDQTGPSVSATLTYVDESTTPLTIEVSYTGGTLTCYPEILAGPGSAAPDLPAHIEMEVELGIRTDDGAFDEGFATVLDGMAMGRSRFSTRIEQAALGGTFDPGLPDHSEVGVRLDGTFSADSSGFGTISKDGVASDGSSTFLQVGQWSTDS
jgi:hypothetical protein